jgi:ubiquinone/menaquinone biosynthesis C-methylase UbiE
MKRQLEKCDMSETEKIIKRYDRVSAIYDLMEMPMEVFAGKWRKEITGEVYGKILEVGVGTGKNIPFYARNIELTAIDFSRKMLSKARAKFSKNMINVTFLERDVQNLEFEDNSFDCVLSSCVFCSVPLPVQGLEEIRRVCKPNGKIVMLEHVRSENKIVGPLMDLLNPLPLYFYGANINRNTMDNIKKADFNNVQVKDVWLDIFKKIIIINEK